MQATEPDEEESRRPLEEFLDPMAEARAAAYYATVARIQRLEPGYATVTTPDFVPNEASLEDARTDLAKAQANVAATIAAGHAFHDHAAEFQAGKQDEFRNLVLSVLRNPSTLVKELSKSRTAYYLPETNTIVIVNLRAPDAGTAFRPEIGAKYFNETLP